MAAYRRVYDSRHLQADCQEPGLAPEPYTRQSNMGYLFITLTLSFQAQNLPFLQILPAVAFLFFFRTDYTDSPDCAYSFLNFSVFHFLVVGFHAVD